MNKIKIIFKLLFTFINKPIIKVSVAHDKCDKADRNADGLLSIGEIISELLRK